MTRVSAPTPAGTTGTTGATTSPSPAVDHTLAILRLLSTRAEPLPAATIAREVAIPRSTTYKLLGILEAHGFVSHLPEDRRYGLGVAAVELGSAFSRQGGISRVARPILRRLVDETGHNAHLAVLHGADVLYLLEERAPGRRMLVTDVGVRLPAHLTASGLAMLAELPAPQVRALYPDPSSFVQRHAPGPDRLSALRAELSRVRRRGFAVEDGTVSTGFASVASAAVDHVGYPVAAVALTYAVEEVDADALPALAASAAAAATELTRRLRGTRLPR